MGFSIESHTIHHLEAQIVLSKGAAERGLKGSKAFFESNDFLSIREWSVILLGAINEDTLKLAKQAGYQMAVNH
ncbi:hypothetical protein R0I01_11690 [Bacillus pumilus]|nr:hypothetical protein R0I01_11690 [Bacillus pumilus]